MKNKEQLAALIAIAAGLFGPKILMSLLRLRNPFIIVFLVIVGLASILAGVIKLVEYEIKKPKPRNKAVKYVGCLSTSTFHRPSCRSVKMLTRENRVDYGTEITCQQLKNIGMKPCSKCKPR